MADLVAQRRAILRKYHGGGAGARVITRTIAGRQVAVSLETGTVVGTAGLTPSQYEAQQREFQRTGIITPPTAERARAEVKRLDTKVVETARTEIQRQKERGIAPLRTKLITLAEKIQKRTLLVKPLKKKITAEEADVKRRVARLNLEKEKLTGDETAGQLVMKSRVLSNKLLLNQQDVLRELSQGSADKQAQKKLRELGTLKKVGLGLIRFPVSVLKGIVDINKAAIRIAKTAREAITHKEMQKLAFNLARANRLIIKGKKRKLTVKESLGLKKSLDALKDKEIKRTVNKFISQLKASKKVLTSEEAKLATQMAVIIGVTAPILAVGGIPALIATRFLQTLGAVATAGAALQFAKEPTPENFGELVFFTIPTAMSILVKLRKLSPRFRPTVKNARDTRTLIRNKRTSNQAEIKKIEAFLKKKGVSKLDKLKAKRILKLLKKQNIAANQAIKELNQIIKNPEIIKAVEFNPQIHTRLFKKLQGSYREGIHVSTQPKAGKLFGTKVEKEIGLKEFLRKVEVEPAVKAKIKVPGILPTFKKKVDTAIFDFIKKRRLVIGGSVAQNVFVRTRFRRKAGDFDVLARSPKRETALLVRQLKRKFPGSRITVTKTKRAYIIKVNGVHFIDIVKLPKKFKSIFVDGVKIVTKKEIILRKFEGITKAILFRRKIKDAKDLARLAEGKVTFKEILIKKKNPSNVFEVVRQPEGMGRSRLAFDETHMFFDFEAPVAYAQGKAYSIIRFPRVRISKFPPNLRRLITKAANGELSTAQSINLRRALNRHIKANPGKFFIAPRTASLPIGEREIVLAETSKFIKRDVYKTFDNDLQKFVNIFEVGFTKLKRKSLAKKFIDGWKRNPFRTLRLRLSNPDILTVRKYARIVERDLRLKPSQIARFLRFLRKLLVIRKPVKEIKVVPKKIVVKEKIPARPIKGLGKIITTSELRRRLKVPKRKIIRIPKRVPKRRVVKRVPRIPARPIKGLGRIRSMRELRKIVRVPKRIVPRRKIPRVPKRRVVKRVPRRITKRELAKRRKIAIVRKRITKIKKLEKKKQKELEKLTEKVIPKQNFIYIPDLYSRVYGIKARPGEKAAFLRAGRVFFGTEARPLIPARLLRGKR